MIRVSRPKTRWSDLAGRAGAWWHGLHEEPVPAQYYRDSRILPIYEGTTAIQANDLVGRKPLGDGAAVAKAVAAQIAGSGRPTERPWRCSKKYAAQLKAGRESFGGQVVDFVLANVKSNPNAVFAGSVSYLMLAANLVSGWQMGRALIVAEDKLAAGRRRRIHDRQDRHRALLRRSHPASYCVVA